MISNVSQFNFVSVLGFGLVVFTSRLCFMNTAMDSFSINAAPRGHPVLPVARFVAALSLVPSY